MTFWCTTFLHGLVEARKIGMRRLMDYIRGNNSTGEKFHKSFPIVWAVGPQGEVVSVSFYLGRGPRALSIQNTCKWPPPTPRHPAVKLECWPPLKIYAREFNGQATREDWGFETIYLIRRLRPTDRYATYQMHCEYNNKGTTPNKRRNEMSLWNPENWVKTNQPRGEAPILPSYKVLEKLPTHEVRSYPRTYWCTTLLHGLEEARRIGVRRLMDYISGFNSRGEKFHKTWPIVWAVGPRGEVVSVSFYMGRGPNALPNQNACHWAPPRPGHPAVRLECWPRLKIYAREFDRQATKEDWSFETIMLTKRLGPTEPYASYQMHCEYNDVGTAPHKRRNEIWLMALA